MTIEDGLVITSMAGRRWRVRVVRQGDRYGLDGCLTWTALKPGVEFYDLTHTREPFGPGGQFVSRYYVETLLDSKARQNGRREVCGLNLHGGESAWQIDAATMGVIYRYLAHMTVVGAL